MINSFSQYLVEEEKVVYFTFGRMNPPTIGHGKLLDKLFSSSGRNPYKVYLSQSQDSSKNPLAYTDKIKHARKMFPKHARNIIVNKKVKTVIDALVDLYNQGYRKAVLVVGSDRVNEFDILLNKYNGKEARHGFYNFQDIKVISAGERDPDAEGVEGMSASKMRGFAKDNDFTSFSQGLPSNVSNKDAKKLFNDVRTGMGLKEEKTFKNHINLPSVSTLREKFVAGEIFNVGDEVILKGTDTVGTITIRGSNYVIVEYNGNRARRWIDSIELIEQDNKKSMYADKPDWGTPESTKKAKKMTPGQPVSEAKTPQDPDIKDREGTQPKRYHAGLSKATKIARDRQFKKQSKMADNDPKAYKPAPGDATAKTQPSKYTKIVRKMVSEQDMDTVRGQIAKEKERAKEQDRKDQEQMKLKHDRILDRARRSRMLQKNRGISEDLNEASFEDKSKASGISVSTLKKVYDRGVAAWKTGHRPGTTPSQWGHARVNAFIAKKKKGTLNHDKDLA